MSSLDCRAAVEDMVANSRSRLSSVAPQAKQKSKHSTKAKSSPPNKSKKLSKSPSKSSSKSSSKSLKSKVSPKKVAGKSLSKSSPTKQAPKKSVKNSTKAVSPQDAGTSEVPNKTPVNSTENKTRTVPKQTAALEAKDFSSDGISADESSAASLHKKTSASKSIDSDEEACIPEKISLTSISGMQADWDDLHKVDKPTAEDVAFIDSCGDTPPPDDNDYEHRDAEHSDDVDDDEDGADSNSSGASSVNEAANSDLEPESDRSAQSEPRDKTSHESEKLPANKKTKRKIRIENESSDPESTSSKPPNKNKKPRKKARTRTKIEERLLKLERREIFLDQGNLSPESTVRRTHRYIIALREHLERLQSHGIGIDIDTQNDQVSIVALTFDDKQFLLRNKLKVMDTKVRPKLTGDALIMHESGATLQLLSGLRNCDFALSSMESITNSMELDVPSIKEGADSAAVKFYNAPNLSASENNALVKNLAEGLDCFSVVCQTQLELYVITKLKLFYIGGIISTLCSHFRTEAVTQKPNLAPRMLEIEVNDKLFRILAGLNSTKLAAAMSDDFDGRDTGSSSTSPARREFFRKWKFRILKFYEICCIEKKLIFTNLPFSFLTRVFPDLESTNRIFRYVKAHPEEFPEWLH